MADIDEDDFFREEAEAVDDGGAPRPRPSKWRVTKDKRKLLVQMVLGMAFLLSLIAVTIVPAHFYEARYASEFSMELTGIGGLDAAAIDDDGAAVSPVFGLRVHIDNPRVVLPWCYNGGEVAVSYSGVALAWGRVPRFCIRKGVPTEFTVLPWGREVGFSEDLRRRLASDRRMGTGQVLVEMRLFCDDNNKGLPSKRFIGPLLHKFQVMLN